MAKRITIPEIIIPRETIKLIDLEAVYQRRENRRSKILNQKKIPKTEKEWFAEGDKNEVAYDESGRRIFAYSPIVQEKYPVDLSKADLKGTKLDGAILFRTILFGADLYKASLRYTILRESNLAEANLEKADLRGADLSETNLYRADLEGMIIDDGEGNEYVLMGNSKD